MLIGHGEEVVESASPYHTPQAYNLSEGNAAVRSLMTAISDIWFLGAPCIVLFTSPSLGRGESKSAHAIDILGSSRSSRKLNENNLILTRLLFLDLIKPGSGKCSTNIMLIWTKNVLHCCLSDAVLGPFTEFSLASHRFRLLGRLLQAGVLYGSTIFPQLEQLPWGWSIATAGRRER